jgi:cell division protein FtsB
LPEIALQKRVAWEKFLSIQSESYHWLVVFTMTFRRTVLAFYALLFVALTMFAGVFFMQTYGEVQGAAAREDEARRVLAELRDRLALQQETLARMHSDRAFIERAIREQLRYARPDEVVFRFERAER